MKRLRRRSTTPDDATLERPYKRIERRLAQGSPLVTTVADSTRMTRVRRHGTSAEESVRRVAWKLGLRLSPPRRRLPGSPDLVNLRRGLAVFVHGCFWHAHPGCRRATTPTRNREFWLAKFQRNRQRDAVSARDLRSRGFCVVTIWECVAEDPLKLARRLTAIAFMASPRRAPSLTQPPPLSPQERSPSG